MVEGKDYSIPSQNSSQTLFNNHLKYNHESEKNIYKSLKEIYDLIPVCYQSLDENGKILFVNKHWLKALGYSELEALGRKFSDFLLKESRDRAKKNFASFKQLGQISDIEYDILKKDGAIITALFSGEIEHDANGKFIRTHCIFQDITHIKSLISRQKMAFKILDILNKNEKDKDAVRDIITELKTFTQFEAVGIRLKDGADYPYYFSHGFSHEFIKAENNLLCRDENGNRILDENKNPLLACMCGNILQSRFNSDLPFFTKKGSFWTNSTTLLLATTSAKDRQTQTRNTCNIYGYESVALIPIYSGNKTIGLIQLNDHRKNMLSLELVEFMEEVGISIGVALQQRQSTKEKTELQIKLLEQQKIESIGLLAGGVAHEINNPMNGIINYAQLIYDELPIGSKANVFADSIIKESDRVTKIVRNLLRFAQKDSDLFGVAKVQDILDESISLLSSLMSKDNIKLEIKISETLPDINCQSQRIAQAVMNLLTNSRDALNERYPKKDEKKIISISAETIDKNSSKWIRIIIEDKGTGIAADRINRIFEPFYTTKPRGEGSGLGLAASRGIIIQNKGEIWVESARNEYTRFYIDLPAQTS